jgi:hypothetical protein
MMGQLLLRRPYMDRNNVISGERPRMNGRHWVPRYGETCPLITVGRQVPRPAAWAILRRKLSSAMEL